MPTDNTPAPAPAVTAEEEARILAEADQYYSKENFLKLHRPQAMNIGLPAKLLPIVYTKLLNQTFDILDSFEVQLVEEEGFRVVVSKEGGLKAGEDVWLIDHLWTTTIDHAQEQLKKVDGLADRLWILANMDIHLENERREAAANAPPAPAAPIAASARPAPVEVELDEDALAAIMAQASVSRDRAVEAYRTNGGDLIQSVVWLGGESEFEKETKAKMEAICEAQMAAQQPADAASSLPQDPSTLTLEQKVPLLWEGLFKYGLVGSYFVTSASNISASALKAEDVESVLYVNDEAGSAVAQAPTADAANAEMQPLICVTLNGAAFSLLWLTKDVAEGEEILIPRRPNIQLPGAPWPKK